MSGLNDQINASLLEADLWGGMQPVLNGEE